MTKTEIISAAEKVFTNLTQTGNGIEEPVFFNRMGEKWSVAENVQHLIISTNTSSLAWYLPLFLVRWMGGTPNRKSRTFDELKDKYYKKLSEGGVAGGRFIPRSADSRQRKSTLIDQWNKAAAKFINTLKKNRSEKDLDNYLVKHPLLGRITLRELGYFTIFHTEHHLHSIQNILKPHDSVL